VFKANVDGTLQVLEFCKNNNIRKMLFGSSSSVYGNSTTSPFREDAECAKPISPYAASKRSGELLCFTYASLYKINIAALRFFTVYGPRQRPDLAIHKFSKMILNREPLPFFGGGNTSRDYTHVSDIVLGLKQAYHWVQIQPSGTFDIFNLGGNKTISLRHLVETLEECLGQKAALDHQPEQAGDVERTCADLTKSSSVLGYMPRISIHDGLKHFTKWILSEYAQPNSNRKVA
jgi:UDP-glucuronate 4-epimerase